MYNESFVFIAISHSTTNNKSYNVIKRLNRLIYVTKLGARPGIVLSGYWLDGRDLFIVSVSIHC